MDELLLNNNIIDLKRTTLNLFKVSLENNNRRLKTVRLGQDLEDAYGSAVHAHSGEILSIYVNAYDTSMDEGIATQLTDLLTKRKVKVNLSHTSQGYRCKVSSYRTLAGKFILGNVCHKELKQAISEAVMTTLKRVTE